MSAVQQPVVAIVGHIDHGKTTLLDYIRKSAVAAREAGGITQRVSAYEIEHANAEGSKLITFIDTPGHEAFQKMRRRSANAADIAILIVAADDGVKPQTVEAKKAIEEAGIPMIVAFTKVDKDTANLEKAKESVLREGVYLEGLGGDVPWAAVSAKTGDGVSELLDLILLVADVQGISADTEKPLKAVVIESQRDPRSGISATVIVREGTLSTGGFAVSGTAYAPLRIVENFMGEKVTSIACGKPARIVGFTDEPKVGSVVTSVETKKEAEQAVAQALADTKRVDVVHSHDVQSEKPAIRVVLKADTAGSVEALEYELGKISQEKVGILIAGKGVGTINENDVKLLIGFSPAALIGFNVKIDASAKDLAERQHIMVETKDIIYQLTEWLGEEVKKYVPDDTGDAITGTAKILKQFSTSGAKHVVGARIETGVIKLGEMVSIIRRDIEIGRGKITNLQQQRSDVSSIGEGMECGMQIDTKADVVAGDMIQAGGKKHGQG